MKKIILKVISLLTISTSSVFAFTYSDSELIKIGTDVTSGSGVTCTSGFFAENEKYPNKQFMISAGHCFEVGESVNVKDKLGHDVLFGRVIHSKYTWLGNGGPNDIQGLDYSISIINPGYEEILDPIYNFKNDNNFYIVEDKIREVEEVKLDDTIYQWSKINQLVAPLLVTKVATEDDYLVETIPIYENFMPARGDSGGLVFKINRTVNNNDKNIHYVTAIGLFVGGGYDPINGDRHFYIHNLAYDGLKDYMPIESSYSLI